VKLYHATFSTINLTSVKDEIQDYKCPLHRTSQQLVQWAGVQSSTVWTTALSWDAELNNPSSIVRYRSLVYSVSDWKPMSTDVPPGQPVGPVTVLSVCSRYTQKARNRCRNLQMTLQHPCQHLNSVTRTRQRSRIMATHTENEINTDECTAATFTERRHVPIKW
jgi:hypothetical protein